MQKILAFLLALMLLTAAGADQTANTYVLSEKSFSVTAPEGWKIEEAEKPADFGSGEFLTLCSFTYGYTEAELLMGNFSNSLGAFNLFDAGTDLYDVFTQYIEYGLTTDQGSCTYIGCHKAGQIPFAVFEISDAYSVESYVAVTCAKGWLILFACEHMSLDPNNPLEGLQNLFALLDGFTPALS